MAVDVGRRALDGFAHAHDGGQIFRAAAVPVMMEVHDFMDACRARMEKQDFVVHVFPNAKDSFDAPVRQLLESLQDELDLVE